MRAPTVRVLVIPAVENLWFVDLSSRGAEGRGLSGLEGQRDGAVVSRRFNSFRLT